MHVLGEWIVVLGMCGVKLTGEGVLGTLAWVSLKQPIWDQGWGCTFRCIPALMVFGGQVLGFYYTLGEHELA
jgi:hypothetical protein